MSHAPLRLDAKNMATVRGWVIVCPRGTVIDCDFHQSRANARHMCKNGRQRGSKVKRCMLIYCVSDK